MVPADAPAGVAYVSMVIGSSRFSAVMAGALGGVEDHPLAGFNSFLPLPPGAVDRRPLMPPHLPTMHLEKPLGSP